MVSFSSVRLSQSAAVRSNMELTTFAIFSIELLHFLQLLVSMIVSILETVGTFLACRKKCDYQDLFCGGRKFCANHYILCLITCIKRTLTTPRLSLAWRDRRV